MICFHNEYHLGDCLPCIHLLNKLSLIVDDDILFSCKSEYHWQLKEICRDYPRVKISDSIANGSINLWEYPRESLDYSLPWPHHNSKTLRYPQLDDVGLFLFRKFAYKLISNNILFPFTNKNDLIFDEDIFSEGNYDNYDYLVINSDCLSGQMKHSTDQQDDLFLEFVSKLEDEDSTFITTKKLGSYPCTRDSNMSVLNIGQISKNVETVIGVPTSPFFTCINKFSLARGVKYVTFTHDASTFDYGEQFITITNLEEYNI